jgi:4-diphosphocytidyl-2-C-methyl-D-erythritol kinase
MTLRARAPGKVNLCLFVGEPREDGLHPVVSVVQPLSLADELTLERAPPGTEHDEVVCPGVDGPNLAGRALAAFREATGWAAPPQRLTIRKRVPVAAGMGGGSGDAAAALRLAAHAAGGRPDIDALAPGLGADVPAQIEPRRALVTGVGERVEPLPEGPPLAVLVVPLDAALSTPDVYREADRLGLARPHAELAELEALVRAAAGAGALPADLVHNDLQDAARALCPAIQPALAAVEESGAEHTLVAGSGPTVVGLGPLEWARETAESMRGSWPRAVAAEPVGAEWAHVT